MYNCYVAGLFRDLGLTNALCVACIVPTASQPRQFAWTVAYHTHGVRQVILHQHDGRIGQNLGTTGA